MTNFKRHQEVAREQAKQGEVNTAKFLAYATGCYDGGWLVECSGHIDGFPSDYLFVHSNPANIACHKVQTVHVLPGEQAEYREYLEEVLDECQKENQHRPCVTEITDADIAQHKTALAEIYGQYFDRETQSDRQPKTKEEWLTDLLANSIDETACDTARLAAE